MHRHGAHAYATGIFLMSRKEVNNTEGIPSEGPVRGVRVEFHTVRVQYAVRRETNID